MKKIFLIFIFNILYFRISFSQESHGCGLILEDLSKVSWLKEYKSLSKVNASPTADISQYLPPVGDQGSSGSCVAWATAYYVKSYLEWREHNWEILYNSHQFSPSFVYNQLNGGQDAGISFGNAVKLLMDFGCATLSDMPFNQTELYNFPSAQAYLNAMDYRCEAGYYVLCNSTSGLDQVKQLISEGNPLVLGIRVYSNLDNIRLYNYNYCLKDISGSERGAHAITIVGYDDTKKTKDGTGAFKFINSWGASWGKSGYGWMSYEAVQDSRVSVQQMLYIIDKIGYKSKLRSKLNISHPSRGQITFQLGLGDPEASIWKKDFRFNNTSGIEKPFSSNDIAFDLTDCFNNLNFSGKNRFYIKVTDNLKDSYNGTINNFSIEKIDSNLIFNTNEVPKTIPDSGSSIISIDVTGLKKDSRIYLIRPSSGETNVLISPSFIWNKSADLQKYCIQVSLNNQNFESQIIKEQNNLSDTSFIFYGLNLNTIYYWRVGSKEQNLWSDIVSFKTSRIANNGPYKVSKVDFSWVDISNDGNQISQWENLGSNGVSKTSDQVKEVMDDGFTGKPIPLGFDFNYFGTNYSSIYVGINGVVSFTEKFLNSYSTGLFSDSDLANFDPTFFPPHEKHYKNSIAAAFFDFDLNPDDGYGGGKVLYKTLNNQFILSWEYVGTFGASGDLTNSFQLILDKNSGSITIQFKKFGLDDTRDGMKVGLQYNDTTALMWYSMGSPIENYINNQSAVKFYMPLSNVNILSEAKPDRFNLEQNYPNPFNNSTRINYNIQKNSFVTLKIYNAIGQEITTLINGMQSEGKYSVDWNPNNLPSGMYFYKLSSSDFNDVKKMVFLK